VSTPSRTRAWLDRADVGVGVVLAVGATLLYVRTLAPGLLIDDSGEFQTMARLLGHTHPTGYEAYTLLARAFATVPLGAFPTRVSAFSAVMGGVVVGLLYVTARLLGCPRPISVVPALAVAASPTFWSQAVIAEVYTAAAALGLGVLAAVLRWYRIAHARWLVTAGIAGGLGLGVHFTVGLYLPAVVVFLLVSARRAAEGTVVTGVVRRVWLPAAVGGLAGAGLALAAFAIVDVADPPSQYFEAVVAPSRSAWDLEPGQIDGLVDRLRFDWTARQFSSLMFSEPGLLSDRLDGFASGLPDELAPVILLAAAIGAAWLFAREWRIGVLLSIALATHLAFAFNYDIGELIYVFYIPVYLLIAVMAARGLTAAADGLRRLAIPGSRAVLGISALAVTFGVVPIGRPNVTSAVVSEVPAFRFEGYPYDDYVARSLHPVLTATVDELPREAIVFVDWEMLYPFYYVAHVERGRTDLTFHETFAADDQEGVAASLVEYIADEARRRPVLVSERIPELESAGFSLLPARVGPTPFFAVQPTDALE
jgi:hypothetical protein